MHYKKFAAWHYYQLMLNIIHTPNFASIANNWFKPTLYSPGEAH